jgi:membrane protein involved in colicin uptake
MNGWVSPRLRIRFEISDDDLRLYRPDGRPFLTELELDRQVGEWQHRAETEKDRADEEQRRATEQQRRADAESRRADDEKRRAERLAAQLKRLGIEPEP